MQNDARVSCHFKKLCVKFSTLQRNFKIYKLYINLKLDALLCGGLIQNLPQKPKENQQKEKREI